LETGQENRPNSGVTQSRITESQKAKSPLNSGLCDCSAASLWGESLTRRLYGGERGIGYRAGIEFETNFRLNLDTPGEGLIRTAFGLF
jgi:hypothetical protein